MMLKKVLLKIKDDPQNRMNTLSTIVVSVGFVYLLLLVWMVVRINGIYLDNNKDNQDRYCEQIAINLNVALESGADVDELCDIIIKNVDASGNSWPYLIKDEEVVFAKNSSTTKTLVELKDRDKFIVYLKNQGGILSRKNFGENSQYEFGIITDKSKYTSASGTLSVIVFMVLIWTSLVIISVSFCLEFAGRWTRFEKKYNSVTQQLKVRNEEFETVKNKNEEYFETTELRPQQNGRSSRYKQYAFKFYINARHAIYIDGKMGAMHPHTWEIKLYVIKVSNDFIQFNQLEKEIEALIAPFQDKEINSIEPFNVLNPTLENCCNYFREEITKILKDKGWLLMMIEMSETPSRSYVMNMIANDT